MSKNKKTYEDIKRNIESIKIHTLITNKEEFEEQIKHTKLQKIKLTLKCIHGYYYSMTYYSYLKSKENISIFHIINSFTVYNIKLWCTLNDKPFELVGDIYEGAFKKLQWQCLKEECREIFESSWSDISQGHGCGMCHGKQVGLSNCLATNNPQLASEWHTVLNGDLTPHNVTKCSSQDAWWECSENSKHIWQAKISNRQNGKGCPVCSESKGEKECKKVFDNKYIIYERQKEFDGLVGLGGGLLSYDFYVPNKYNLLIEYQGLQHESFCKGFHKTIEDFEKQVEHDKRKKEYALSNGYNFLEIWYWDFDNIEEILEKELISIINK